MQIWYLILFAVPGALLFLSLRRGAEVVVLRVDRGRITVLRGAVSPRVLAELGEVARRRNIQSGKIRIVRDRGRARAECRGLGDGDAQRVRNVVGTFPLPRLLAGARRR